MLLEQEIVISMIENCLTNIICCFFPKGIDSSLERERYLNSKEFIYLSNYLKKIDSNLIIEKLIKEIRKDEQFKKIVDRTSLFMDRCLTFELEKVENDSLIRIVIEISLIFPYFYIYISENKISTNPYKWLTLPKRNLELEEKYAIEIDSLKKIIIRKTGYTQISNDIVDFIIDDISFQDVKKGKFTVYNAFFKDEKI